MALDFEPRPDDAKIIAVEKKEYTVDGLPCQVHVVAGFFLAGVQIAAKKVTINPGWIAEHFPTLNDVQRDEKFLQFFNAIPDIPQQVLDAISAKIPDAAYVAMWK